MKKLESLIVKNFKRAKDVKIVPEGNLVLITGKNDNGKSSVIEGFKTLINGKPKDITDPVRHGAKKAELSCVIGGFKVERIFNKAGKMTTFKVTDPSGENVSNPQALLNSFKAKLAFDPIELMKMKPKEQREVLLRLAGIDFEELDKQRTTIYDQRRDIGVLVKNCPTYTEDEIALAKKYEGKEEVSAAKINEEYLDAVSQHNRYQEAVNEIKNNTDLAKKLQEQINGLLSRNLQLSKLEKPETSLEELKLKAENISDENNKIRIAHDILKKNEAKKAKAAEYEAKTTEIADIDKKKEETLKEAKMPIVGLSIDEEQILYNSVPLSQASTSGKIKVCMAVAMALNPELRIIIISDGSMLDEPNMAIVAKMIEDRDYMLMIETVASKMGDGFYLEAGELAAIDGVVQELDEDADFIVDPDRGHEEIKIEAEATKEGIEVKQKTKHR